MRKEKSKAEYKKGRIGEMVHFIAMAHGLDEKYLRAQLVVKFPELKDHKHCANCEASMAEYPCNLTYFTAELLTEMMRIIYGKMNKGMDFTTANQVHRKQITGGYTVASQFTIAAKLGLIAKVMKKTGEKSVHDTEKGWLITARGFAFLKGQPVPARVMVFRNKIQDRPDALITIQEIYAGEFTKYDQSISMGIEIERQYATPRLL